MGVSKGGEAGAGQIALGFDTAIPRTGAQIEAGSSTHGGDTGKGLARFPVGRDDTVRPQSEGRAGLAEGEEVDCRLDFTPVEEGAGRLVTGDLKELRGFSGAGPGSEEGFVDLAPFDEGEAVVFVFKGEFTGSAEGDEVPEILHEEGDAEVDAFTPRGKSGVESMGAFDGKGLHQMIAHLVGKGADMGTIGIKLLRSRLALGVAEVEVEPQMQFGAVNPSESAARGVTAITGRRSGGPRDFVALEEFGADAAVIPARTGLQRMLSGLPFFEQKSP